ncbi:MAG: ribosomal protein S18-alanine N-acetyltransferase [Clostridiales Family XIII bacterium]|jgi:ribosomal-protein-alanine N-acetyltransferase|nr:ribosomal protein S18-alanine N-acetyltransferase [Clostridiales Family XIII bacterium]
MRFDIREATRADAEAIAEIEIQCFSSPWSFKDILREIEENELARYIVCEKDLRVVSYAGLWVILNEGHIMNVAVHTDFRGRGIGAAMIESLIERAGRESGVTDFTLEVRASNDAAIRLYERAGFRKKGLRPCYYSVPDEDAYIMWLHNI